MASVPLAFQVAQQASKAMEGNEQNNKLQLGLINALKGRYAATVEEYVEKESELTQRFASKMEDLLCSMGGAKANPNLAALVADALMNTSPWDYWMTTGHLRPTAGRAKRILEEALSGSPRHAFCIHLLVHVTEASGNRTLLQEVRPWAEILPKLMPGAPHLIHMSFHTLMHTGNFHLADGDNTLATKLPRQIYPMHNLDTLSWVCRIEGRSLCSLDAAKSLEHKALPLINTTTFETGFPPARFAAVWPLTLLAFGRFREILAEVPPAECQMDPFLAGIWHFARGAALAALAGSGEEELKLLQAKKLEVIAALSSPAGLAWKNFNGSKDWAVYPAKELLDLAEAELRARLGEHSLWEEAFRLESTLPYDEPPAWYLPVANRYGADLAARGRVAEAWEVYTQTLSELPHNGWALFGQWKLCEQRFGPEQANCHQLHENFKKAWRHADISLDINPQELEIISSSNWVWCVAILGVLLVLSISAWRLCPRATCASCSYQRLDGP